AVKSLCSFKKMALGLAKTETTTYDGWGRPVITEDAMGRVIRIHYDALGHQDDVTDPSGNHIHLVYNLSGKVTERWALPVSGGRYLLSSSGYNNAGQLMYKSGEDGKKTIFTYTKTGQRATAITPGRHQFLWQYNEVGLPIAKYIDGKVSLQTYYDYITAQPVKKQDISGITIWKYSVDGLMKEEKHTGENGYPDYYLSWNYNSERKIISSCDIEGDMTYIKYDKFGRIASVSYKPQQGNIQILYVPYYDSFSRINAIHYGSGMQRVIYYDGWGHQLNVTDMMDNKLLSRWQFGYNADNDIVRLRRQATNHQEAVLNYQYDQLDNLVSMHCNGSFGLPLCPRDTLFSGSSLTKAPIITRQNYSFTPLNRLSQVKEVLQNTDTQQTLSKTVTYHYNNIEVPLRLQQTETQWNQQAPVTQNLYYDSAGNMTTDGEGDHITYNIFNQITRIIKPNGEQSHYTYDDNGLERVEENASGRYYLFYNGNKLINEKIINMNNESHIIGYHGVARSIDSVIHEYTEQNYKNDIVGILTKITKNNNHLYQLTQRNIYSPYGMIWQNKPTPLTFSLRNFFGFDGERTDPASGWQFLGAGHRTYNPQQRYFFSEDPAGDGYAFAGNNPIMRTDPSGNISKSANKIFRILRHIGTFGLGALFGKEGYIAGSLLMFALSTVIPVLTMVKCGGKWSALMVGLAMSFAGTVSFVAATSPHNRGLNIAAAAVGIVQITATIISTMWAIPKLYNCCYSLLQTTDELSSTGVVSEAASVVSNIEESPPPYSSIQMEDFNNNRLLSDVQDLFVTEDDGNYLSITDYGSVQRALLSVINHTGTNETNNTGTILSATMFSGKLLKITKLEEFLNAQVEFSISSVEYRDAFRNIMASLDIPAIIPEGNAPDLYDLFPTEANNAAVIVGKNSIRVIRQVGNNILTPFVTNGIFGSNLYNYDQIMEPFYDTFGNLFIHEYYRIR
ncbi:MAG: hypothetical protein OXC48_07885, partial [Endozoicomonadaceae bacterium]|nr:hypothetical protein [Endozoicomonadaceae bacterium]